MVAGLGVPIFRVFTVIIPKISMLPLLIWKSDFQFSCSLNMIILFTLTG